MTFEESLMASLERRGAAGSQQGRQLCPGASSVPSGCQDRMNVGAAGWGPSRMAPLGLSQPPPHYLPETTCTSRPRACAGPGTVHRERKPGPCLSGTPSNGDVWAVCRPRELALGHGGAPWKRGAGTRVYGMGEGRASQTGEQRHPAPCLPGCSFPSTGQCGAAAPGWGGLRAAVWSAPPSGPSPPFQPASCVQLPARSGLASLVEWCRPL